MYTYDGLNQQLAAIGMTKTQLAQKLHISSRTLAKIGRGEKLSARVLQRIAAYLQCEPEKLYKQVADNPLLQRLREEKAAGISGGIYHELQVRMTYNSNHIEGSQLTEAQTRLIFETATIDAGDGLPVDDILETVHHFRAIDYVIDVTEEPLSEAIIKQLHYILKHDTRDSQLLWFAVGDYKKRPNMVGGHLTTAPADVAARIQRLLAAYNAKEHIDFEAIVTFHATFERIHPFQDGNGRVGRLIALKECLHHNIVPFIIEDRKKAFYYRGLTNWPQEHGWLIDTCLDGQDTFKRLLKQLGNCY